jgi:hypothetical protein
VICAASTAYQKWLNNNYLPQADKLMAVLMYIKGISKQRWQQNVELRIINI